MTEDRPSDVAAFDSGHHSRILRFLSVARVICFDN